MSEMFDPTAGSGPLDPWVLGDIRSFLESNPPRTTIQRLTGRSLVPVDPVYVVTEENTSSTTYIALTTAVAMDKLPPGRYMFFFGHTAALGAGAGPSARAKAALALNGNAPDDNLAISTGGVDPVGGSMIQLVQFTGDNNSLEIQYLTTNNLYAGYFGRRYLACIRYSD